jgi:hypothetical protein
MFDSLSIVIPFRPINEERQVIFDWVYRRTLQTLPGAEVIVSSDARNDQTHFSRSMAINEGVLQSTRANICAMDADLVIDPDTFILGLESLKKFSMTTLMSQVRYLSKETSHKLLESPPKQSIAELEMSSPHVVGQYPASVGGAVMFHRDKFVKMGGFDERLVGWGYEDNVFHAAYSAFFGAPDRLKGYIYHIHHSHAASPSESDYSENNYFQNEYRLIVANNPIENNKKIWEEYCKVKDSPSDLLVYIKKNCISPFHSSI